MSQIALLFLSVLCLGALGSVFGWNVRRGVRTGEIWAKNVRIYRVQQPIGFWITLVVYVAATLLCIGGIGAIIYVLSAN